MLNPRIEGYGDLADRMRGLGLSGFNACSLLARVRHKQLTVGQVHTILDMALAGAERIQFDGADPEVVAESIVNSAVRS